MHRALNCEQMKLIVIERKVSQCKREREAGIKTAGEREIERNEASVIFFISRMCVAYIICVNEHVCRALHLCCVTIECMYVVVYCWL